MIKIIAVILMALAVQVNASEFLVEATGNNVGEIITYKTDYSDDWGTRECLPKYVIVVVEDLDNPEYYCEPVYDSDGLMVKERRYKISRSIIDSLVDNNVGYCSLSIKTFEDILE